jgi:ligand-binding sensor domain-containing protein
MRKKPGHQVTKSEDRESKIEERKSLVVALLDPQSSILVFLGVLVPLWQESEQLRWLASLAPHHQISYNKLVRQETMLASTRKKNVVHWVAWGLGLLFMMSVIVRAERLPIKTYTTADGLGSDFVERIVRDSRGFLWFCTRDGLSRFDGYRFVTYTMEHGLSNPTINHLLETRQGVYWVATNGGGVCRFNPDLSENQKVKGKEQKAKVRNSIQRTALTEIRNLFTVYPVGDERLTNRVNVLYEDRAGWLWAGTDAGLFRFEETTGEGMFRRVELGLLSYSDRLVTVLAFVEDREGSLWMGTSWGLARRWPDGRITHYSIQPSSQGLDEVYALLEDREGRLWVGHYGAGLLRLRTADFGLRNDELMGDSRKSAFRIPHSRSGTRPPMDWPTIG